MKFRDIPQFPHANYHVTVHWRHLKESIEGLGQSIGYDLNPVYQRGYKWNERKKVAYLEYMLNGCSGYIPVFDSIDEANLFSNNGEFQVVEIEVGTPQNVTNQ